MRQSQDHTREGSSGTANRRWRPRVEGLEERLLLYATLGASWTYGSRITYSFVPDGTAVGVNSSSLYQSLSSLGSPDVWQREFAQAAAVWQAVANINLVQVPDNGAPLGSNGYQQGSPYYGDIRISALPLSSGTLGAAYSPPPLNGGTLAGDIVLNSNVAWKIDANYDLETVAIHELGHALGMDHSTIAKAVMYYSYTGIKQSLTSDDVSGLDSIYGAREYDSWNSNGQNNQIYYNAKSLDKYRTSLNQITLTNLDITTSTMTEWFWVTIPQNNIGSFTVTAQSANLSLLAPQVLIFDSSLNYLGGANGASSGYGSTATVTTPGSTGQGFFIRISTAGSSANPSGLTGAYALQINFGTTAMAAVAPPNTLVAAQASQGGGITQMTTSTGPISPTLPKGLPGSAAEAVQNWLNAVQADDQGHHGQVHIGGISAWGDELVVGPTPTVEAQALSAAASFDPSGVRTHFSEAADAMRLAGASSAFANTSNGQSVSTASIDHALAGWNLDWILNKNSRTRRST